MNTGFDGLLYAVDLPDGRRRVVMRDLIYTPVARAQITIPKGFVSDGESTPRILWPILPPWDEFGRAYVLHDWLYWRQFGTRQQADAMLHEAMQRLGASYIRAGAVYAGVRAAGWWAWRASIADAIAGRSRELDPDSGTFARVEALLAVGCDGAAERMMVCMADRAQMADNGRADA